MVSVLWSVQSAIQRRDIQQPDVNRKSIISFLKKYFEIENFFILSKVIGFLEDFR